MRSNVGLSPHLGYDSLVVHVATLEIQTPSVRPNSGWRLHGQKKVNDKRQSSLTFSSSKTGFSIVTFNLIFFFREKTTD